MAQVECEYCGTVYDDSVVSDESISCPYCRELSKNPPKKPKISAIVIVLAFFLVTFAIFCVFLLPNLGSTEKRAQCAENRTGAKAIVSADGRHSWL